MYLPLIIYDNYLATMEHMPVMLVHLPSVADPFEIKATDIIVAHNYCDQKSLMEPPSTHNWYYEKPSDHRFAERKEEPCNTVY